METTNDGFTFRRVSTNKVEHVKLRMNVVKQEVSKANGFEVDGFTFRKVKGRSGLVLGENKEFAGLVGEAADGVAYEVGGRQDSKACGRVASKVGGRQDSHHQPNNHHEKKRKTIQMSDCLDFSTASILGDIPEMPKTDLKETKVKSNEIHKQIEGCNINKLIKECIKFLKDDTLYAQEISNYCSNNYFSDIDYKRDIENIQQRIEVVQNEIGKWNRIYEDSSRKMEVAELVGVDRKDKQAVEEWNVNDEFEGKAGRIKELEGRLVRFLEGAKNRSEVILKSIFGAVENRTVDALFLLKAMSKLGK